MLIGVDHRGCLAAFESRPDDAAHSMDTDWYAVDRSGHVAQLWSDEAGAVPWEAHRQFWDELYEELAVARIATIVASTPSDRRLVLALDSELRSLSPRKLESQWNGVLRFTSREYLEMFCAEHLHTTARALDGLPDTVAVKDIQKFAFDDYWEAGAIVAAYVVGEGVRPRTIGLFEYACSFSGPYNRTAVPAEPLLLESLPAPLRGKLGALRLAKLDFNATTDFDPDKFLRCHHYGS